MKKRVLWPIRTKTYQIVHVKHTFLRKLHDTDDLLPKIVEYSGLYSAYLTALRTGCRGRILIENMETEKVPYHLVFNFRCLTVQKNQVYQEPLFSLFFATTGPFEPQDFFWCWQRFANLLLLELRGKFNGLDNRTGICSMYNWIRTQSTATAVLWVRIQTSLKNQKWAT